MRKSEFLPILSGVALVAAAIVAISIKTLPVMRIDVVRTESVTMNDLDPDADVPVIDAVWLAGAPEPPLALYSSVAVNVWVVRSHTA